MEDAWRGLPNVVDLGRSDVVEQHHGNNRHRPILRDFAGAIKTDFFARHVPEVDAGGEFEGDDFAGEAGEAMNSVMAIATIFAAGAVFQDIESVWKNILKSEDGAI